MTSALSMDAAHDRTDIASLVRGGVKLGLIQSALVAAFALLQVRLEGVAELAVCGLILFIGIAATIVLPGQWTGARTIEGIAGSAGIGLASALVFLVVDVSLFQPLHLYTSRWLAIGGGANWWYHPVWWMVGTYLPWMGAWIQASQARRNGQANPALMVAVTAVLAAILLGLAVVAGVPNAAWGLGGMGVAVLPALALYCAVAAWGARRG
jgi:hypothetical protein